MAFGIPKSWPPHKKPQEESAPVTEMTMDSIESPDSPENRESIDWRGTYDQVAARAHKVWQGSKRLGSHLWENKTEIAKGVGKNFAKSMTGLKFLDSEKAYKQFQQQRTEVFGEHAGLQLTLEDELNNMLSRWQTEGEQGVDRSGILAEWQEIKAKVSALDKTEVDPGMKAKTTEARAMVAKILREGRTRKDTLRQEHLALASKTLDKENRLKKIDLARDYIDTGLTWGGAVLAGPLGYFAARKLSVAGRLGAEALKTAVDAGAKNYDQAVDAIVRGVNKNAEKMLQGDVQTWIHNMGMGAGAVFSVDYWFTDGAIVDGMKDGVAQTAGVLGDWVSGGSETGGADSEILATDNGTDQVFGGEGDDTLSESDPDAFDPRNSQQILETLQEEWGNLDSADFDKQLQKITAAMVGLGSVEERQSLLDQLSENGILDAIRSGLNTEQQADLDAVLEQSVNDPNFGAQLDAEPVETPTDQEVAAETATDTPDVHVGTESTVVNRDAPLAWLESSREDKGFKTIKSVVAANLAFGAINADQVGVLGSLINQGEVVVTDEVHVQIDPANRSIIINTEDGVRHTIDAQGSVSKGILATFNQEGADIEGTGKTLRERAADINKGIGELTEQVRDSSGKETWDLAEDWGNEQADAVVQKTYPETAGGEQHPDLALSDPVSESTPTPVDIPDDRMTVDGKQVDAQTQEINQKFNAFLGAESNLPEDQKKTLQYMQDILQKGENISRVDVFPVGNVVIVDMYGPGGADAESYLRWVADPNGDMRVGIQPGKGTEEGSISGMFPNNPELVRAGKVDFSERLATVEPEGNNQVDRVIQPTAERPQSSPELAEVLKQQFTGENATQDALNSLGVTNGNPYLSSEDGQVIVVQANSSTESLNGLLTEYNANAVSFSGNTRDVTSVYAPDGETLGPKIAEIDPRLKAGVFDIILIESNGEVMVNTPQHVGKRVSLEEFLADPAKYGVENYELPTVEAGADMQPSTKPAVDPAAKPATGAGAGDSVLKITTTDPETMASMQSLEQFMQKLGTTTEAQLASVAELSKMLQLPSMPFDSFTVTSGLDDSIIITTEELQNKSGFAARYTITQDGEMQPESIELDATKNAKTSPLPDPADSTVKPATGDPTPRSGTDPTGETTKPPATFESYTFKRGDNLWASLRDEFAAKIAGPDASFDADVASDADLENVTGNLLKRLEKMSAEEMKKYISLPDGAKGVVRLDNLPVGAKINFQAIYDDFYNKEITIGDKTYSNLGARAENLNEAQVANIDRVQSAIERGDLSQMDRDTMGAGNRAELEAREAAARARAAARRATLEASANAAQDKVYGGDIPATDTQLRTGGFAVLDENQTNVKNTNNTRLKTGGFAALDGAQTASARDTLQTGGFAAFDNVVGSQGDDDLTDVMPRLPQQAMILIGETQKAMADAGLEVTNTVRTADGTAMTLTDGRTVSVNKNGVTVTDTRGNTVAQEPVRRRLFAENRAKTAKRAVEKIVSV